MSWISSRQDEESRRREILDFTDEAIAAIDAAGRVAWWGDALERLAGCKKADAVGRLLVDAVPALRDTALPAAIADVLNTRRPRTLSFNLKTASGTLTLQVKIVAAAGGATLVWLDVSDRARAERQMTREVERLALATEGATDGLWEWDLRTSEFYRSARWSAMLGLSTAAGLASPQEWLGRVHPDDVRGLEEAIEALVARRTPQLEHEHRMRHENGAYRWFLCRGVAAPGGRRASRIAGSLTDTTDRVVAREQLRNAGSLDPLTGLRNRADFMERLGGRLDQFKRRGGDRFAVLYLDLDRLKLVNDSLGHPVGDELLVAVARRLESCLRQEDHLARLGGDEFAILLNSVGDEHHANVVALRIQEALNAPQSVGGRDIFTSVSIGIVIGHGHYGSADEIVRDADTAMYQAKSRGKARHETFDAEMHARAIDRLGLEHDLRHAVNHDDFEVVFQPIVLLKTGRCVGFESLVRWTRSGKPVSPALFIPIAEELGVIEPLGTWILREATRTFAEWQRKYPASGLNCITVNASSRQLTKPNFRSLVEDAVVRARLNPADVRIEVTETALMDNPQAAAQVLQELRDFGVKIYLDDFGTGCSSLSHLHKLPVDALKIDRSFVMSLLLPERPAIVESILALARTLRTNVVAEGIESEEQANALERLGCTHAQGYLFSRPLSKQAAEDLIRTNEPLGPKRPGAAPPDATPYYSSKPIEFPAELRPA